MAKWKMWKVVDVEMKVASFSCFEMVEGEEEKSASKVGRLHGPNC